MIMKKLQIMLTALLIAAGFGAGAKAVSAQTSHHYNLLPAETLPSIAGVRVEYGDGELPDRQLGHDDFPALSRYLSGVEYDTARNDNGIMIKPVTADYTIIVTYDPAARREDDVISVWTTGGHLHHRGKWYTMQPDTAAELGRLLTEDHRDRTPLTR